MKKTFPIIMAIMGSIYGGMVAYADGGTFTVHPTYTHDGNKSWIIQSIAHGSSMQDSITVENLSNQEQKISLLVKEADNENNKFIPQESENYKAVGLWTKLSETKLTLAAGEIRKIPFEIIIPKNTPQKEYNGVIYAIRETDQRNIKIVTRIGVRMYIHVISPNILGANIFNSSAYKNSFFFILSFIGLIAGIGYNLIHIIENKKYEKQQA